MNCVSGLRFTVCCLRFAASSPTNFRCWRGYGQRSIIKSGFFDLPVPACQCDRFCNLSSVGSYTDNIGSNSAVESSTRVGSANRKPPTANPCCYFSLILSHAHQPPASPFPACCYLLSRYAWTETEDCLSYFSGIGRSRHQFCARDTPDSY